MFFGIAVYEPLPLRKTGAMFEKVQISGLIKPQVIQLEVRCVIFSTAEDLLPSLTVSFKKMPYATQ